MTIKMAIRILFEHFANHYSLILIFVSLSNIIDIFVSEANLQHPPVRPSVRQSVRHKILSGQLLLNRWMD